MFAFRFLPHTADIRLQVTADTREELYRSALQGMGHLQKKNFCKKQNGVFAAQEKIHVIATDQTSLLIDFLSEVLTLSHINKVVYCDLTFDSLAETALTATIKGNQVDYFDEDIKAVTYHEAEVKQNKKKGWETLIIFDI